MSQRRWVWVSIGLIVSTVLLGGVAFAVGQRVSWQVLPATVEDSGATALPSVQAPEAGKTLQPLTLQGGDRGAIGQGQLLAQDGGGEPPGCRRSRGKRCK